VPIGSPADRDSLNGLINNWKLPRFVLRNCHRGVCGHRARNVRAIWNRVAKKIPSFRLDSAKIFSLRKVSRRLPSSERSTREIIFVKRPGRRLFLKAIDAWIGLDPRLGDKVEFVFMGKRDDELLRQRLAMTHPEVIRVEPHSCPIERAFKPLSIFAHVS
jgi:hypothetical protein